MSKRLTRGFTLVELLVVIGIIALLISILLPSLSKAREQANTVACASTLRQFHQLWNMYATQNKGMVITARTKYVGSEYWWHEPQFLGSVMKANLGGPGSGTDRNKDNARIIKQVLQCKAVDHSYDPDPSDVAATANGTSIAYYGDYIYNTWMGYRTIDANGNTDTLTTIPTPKLGKIPGNVIIMMESYKPNAVRDASGKWINNPDIGTGYKGYFQKNNEIWTTNVTAGNPASALQNFRYGTPHSKGKKMNVLSVDGRITLVDPKVDFFQKPSDQSTVKDYLWDAKASYPFTAYPNWRKGADGL